MRKAGVSHKCAVSFFWPVDPAPETNSAAAHGPLISWSNYLCISLLFAIDDAASVPVGLSVSVCDFWHFGCGEQREKWSQPVCRIDLASARISCFYQARGEDSLGLLGFSGVWVSLRALCNTKTQNLILIAPFYFQTQSTFGYSTSSGTLGLSHLAAGCCTFVRAHQQRVWICQTPAVFIKIWAANLQDQVQIFLADSNHLKLTSNLMINSANMPKKASVLVDLLSSPK